MDSLYELQEEAKKHSHFTVVIPLYDVELADKICKFVRKKVRAETVCKLSMLLDELDRKSKKLKELGLNPDLI